MDESGLSVPSTHPYSAAVDLANVELAMARDAVASGNEGRARVCGRRAVGTFLQTIGPTLGVDFGSHALANLRCVRDNPELPSEIRTAAERLLGGARNIAASEPYSADPLADATHIINYFVLRTS